MNDKIFEAFLKRQLTEGTALARSSDVLKLNPMPSGDAPSRYIVHFEGRKGLVRDDLGDIAEFEHFAVGIWFRDDYLRRVEVAEVLTYLGPHPRPWQPNLRPPFICAHIEPGTALVDLIYACFEIWTWNLYSTGDEGLDHAVSQWARRQDKSRFPIDRRPLKRRPGKIDVTASPVKEAL